MIGILTFAAIRYLHTISKQGQDTQEMLHATASLVLCMCCLELSPFWACDNCSLKGQLWLCGGSVSLLRKGLSWPVQATKPKEKVRVLVLFKVGQNSCLYQSVWYKSKVNCKTQLGLVLKLSETHISLQMFNKRVFRCLGPAHELCCHLPIQQVFWESYLQLLKSIGSLAE